MRSAFVAVALAAMCVLAGCNAFAPGATTDDTEVPTVTPADVPRATTDRIAPGLTGERVTDGAALLDAHRAVVANRTVTVEQFSRAVAPNGTRLYDRRLTYRYAADRSRVEAVGRGLQANYGSSVDVWANGSVGLFRYGGADDPRYRRQSVGVPLDPIETFRYELRELAEGNVPVEVRSLGTQDGYERFRVVVETPARGTRPTVFVVDERGFVTEIHRRQQTTLSYEGGTVEDATTESVTRYAVSNETLATPAWVDDAREAIADREYVAPGVTSDGIVDTRALVEAHRGVVANRSVTYVSERRVERNGTVERVDRQVRRRSVETDRYLSVDRQVRDGAVERDVFWANASAGYVERTADGETMRYRSERPGTPRHIPTPEFRGAVEYQDATVTRLDDGRFRVVITDYRPGYRYGDAVGRLLNGTLAVVVDDRGFVSRVDRTVVSEAGDGGVARTTETARYTGLGNTTVERPDWLAAAANATGD